MAEQLESALLTTDDSLGQNGNNIKEFNSYTVYLDGKGSIVSLGIELQKAADEERNSLKWRTLAVIMLTLSLLGDVFAILLIAMLSQKAGGIVLAVISIIFTIISLILCYSNFKNRASKKYFVSEWRDGLKFDVMNKCIKEIKFKPDYGLDVDASIDMKYVNVHEPIIEEQQIKIICSFDDVTDIGQTIHRNNNADIIGYQFYIGFENKKDSKWTANIVKGRLGAQRYPKLKQVIKSVNNNWLNEIEVID